MNHELVVSQLYGPASGHWGSAELGPAFCAESSRGDILCAADGAGFIPARRVCLVPSASELVEPEPGPGRFLQVGVVVWRVVLE